MNFFIYGARRSGKSTKTAEILRLFKDIPIIWNGGFSTKKTFEQQFNVRFKNNPAGFKEYVTIHENVDTMEVIAIDYSHNIVTATPNNSKRNPTTSAYILYLQAIEQKWAIIKLGRNPTLVPEYYPEEQHYGSIEGLWYDPLIHENTK